jgi:hypothetical protein
MNRRTRKNGRNRKRGGNSPMFAHIGSTGHSSKTSSHSSISFANIAYPIAGIVGIGSITALAYFGAGGKA